MCSLAPEYPARHAQVRHNRSLAVVARKNALLFLIVLGMLAARLRGRAIMRRSGCGPCLLCWLGSFLRLYLPADRSTVIRCALNPLFHRLWPIRRNAPLRRRRVSRCGWYRLANWSIRLLSERLFWLRSNLWLRGRSRGARHLRFFKRLRGTHLSSRRRVLRRPQIRRNTGTGRPLARILYLRVTGVRLAGSTCNMGLSWYWLC